MAARPDSVAPGRSTTPIAACARYVETLPDGACVMVALSGGGDSVGLLVALMEARRMSGRNLRICAATVDHRLRAGSAAEAGAMERLCARHGLAHRTLVWDAEKPGSGISEAARQARYDLLVAAARDFAADVIVTGHTLDDQLETVEMRRLRRDEGRGLAGMATRTLFDGWCWVDRPFLDVERGAIRDFLTGTGISWFDDPSNDNSKYERVRMRQAGVFSTAAEQVRRLAGHRRDMANEAAEFVAGHVTMPVALLFKVTLENTDIDEAARLAIAYLIAIAGGREHLAGQAQLQRLWGKLKTGADFRHSLGRTVLERRKRCLYIGRDGRNMPPPLVLEPGAAALWDGRFMVVNRQSDSIAVQAGGAPGAGTADVPKRVAARAQSALPSEQARPEVAVYLAPFEHILPDFEFELANAFASLCDRPAFPAHP